MTGAGEPTTCSNVALLVGALFAAMVFVPAAQLTGEGCASAAGQVRVGLVIDRGTLQGAPSPRVLVECATVDDGANGFAALAARGHTVRVNSAGLVCAIDGYPGGTECGTRTADGYRYWAYFHGGDSWTYAPIGPGTTRMHDGSVEGWHFLEGNGNPSDPPPAAPSSASTICPPPPGPAAAPQPPPAAALGVTPSVVGPRTTNVPTSMPANPTGGPQPVDAGAPATTAQGDSEVTAGSVSPAPAGTSESNPLGTPVPGSVAPGSAGDPTSSRTSSGGGVPIGVIAALVIVAGLGVGSVVRSRRRLGTSAS